MEAQLIMKQETGFGSKAGFIFAAVGSAIGLGNIWRFPAVAYENGGGAFFIPYLIALLTTGLGFLILEFSLGNKFRGSSPLVFFRINKKFEMYGWFPVFITFIISTYYTIILAYSINYLVSSFTSGWGDDTEAYFFNNVLHVSEDPATFGHFVPGILIPVLLIWLVVLTILFRGVKKGIEAFNKIMIPVLIIMFSMIVIRAVTLPGALTGLDALFTPDWSSIMKPSVWVAAYGQIFFSLSLAMGIMITYSSYMPKKSELSNSALITGFANSSFELLAGIGVFSALGFMANNLEVPISEVSSAGIGLAFVVFPEILSTMPASQFFSVLFFGSLTIAGLTSLVSVLEVPISALIDKFNLSRRKAIAFVSIPSMILSSGYTMQNGIHILDVVDYFINNIAIVTSALLLILITLFITRQGKHIIEFVNLHSYIKIGTKWFISLAVVTPILLCYMFINSLYTIITDGYGGFKTSFLLTYGWSVIAFLFIGSIVISQLKWHKDVTLQNTENQREVI